jgi:hypothetical protein
MHGARVHRRKNVRELDGSTLIGAESLVPRADREAVTLNASGVESLDEYSVRQLIEFFEILDRWDRETHGS